MAALVLLIVLPLIIAASAVVNGFVLVHLWGWFFVPVLGLPLLSIPQAVGISLVVSFLTHQAHVEKENPDGVKVLTSAFLRPLLALLIGWVVKQFMGGA